MVLAASTLIAVIAGVEAKASAAIDVVAAGRFTVVRAFALTKAC